MEFFSHFMFIGLLVSTMFSLQKLCRATDIQLNDEVLGLIVFKSGLQDPSSHLSSWNEDDDSPCAWDYIKCNPANGRVTELSLDGLNLSGKLGKGLQKLQDLKVLSLSNNHFAGSINPELAFIPSLESLNLSGNSFSDRIPDSLANLSALKFLDLSQNSLSGPLPDDTFQSSYSLRYLSLAGNALEGPIPSSLMNCVSLSNLNLSNNHLSGSVDFANGVYRLQRLRTLDLSNNILTGNIPQGISVIHNLKDLRFQGNHFSGNLPADIGLCSHLSRLDLSYNLFTGEIPESLKSLSFLAFLSLSNNMLTGDFPGWVSSLSSVEYLDFSSNSLSGNLPSSMGDLQMLNFLSVANNEISGSIPDSVVHCSKLSVIRLSRNHFNGSIPEGLFSLGLEEVDFSRNGLMGSVPAGSSKLFESLRVLDLSANSFTGDIPADLGLFSNLKYLNLSWNNLHSRIPPELGFFPNLTVLDLRSSSLYGMIPGDLCDARSLGILQLDGNFLTGPIPQEIGNCSSLFLLSLSHNSLNGTVPESMSMLSKLKILKLENNQLSGEIPQGLGKLENLLAVNISYNRLTGRLPAGNVFQTLDQTAIEGNLGICSPLLKGPCKMDVPKPLVLDPYAYGHPMDGPDKGRGESSTPARFRHHKFLSISAIIAISAAIFIMFGVLIISFLNVSARRRLTFIDNALESMCSSSSLTGSPATGKLILFDSKSSSQDYISDPEHLLNKATEIGTGIFGTVHKVPLGVEGRMVAVKRLVTPNILQFPEDFDREVRVIGKAKHPNLIALKGYYWTPQMQLLVMDYASNGNLQTKLHEKIPTGLPLSWSIRYKILLGTAKGLAYLHHSHRPPLVHYSLKPSNILLDEEYNPMISDFGQARLLTKLDKHVTSNRFQNSLGYLAPELSCQNLRVTEKCDVFAFGILVLEIVTGKRPVEYGEDNVVILSDHVRILLEQGNALDCVDPSMNEYPEEEVLPVLKLALVCASQIPSSRPSMAEVVQILQVIKTPVSHRMDAF